MRNRIWVGLIVFLCMVFLASTALADVLWEPNDNFYRVKREECEILGRSFTANGYDGKVVVWKEPGSSTQAGEVPNGSEFFVSFTYTDSKGNVWGVVQYTYDPQSGTVTKDYRGDGATNGWVLMTDLSLVYDYISFDEEHKEEFSPFAGAYDELLNTKEIIFWSYPGSGEVVYVEDQITEDFSFDYTYTDAAGRQWGYVNYYRGGPRDFWICIDDPANQDLPANTPRPVAAPPSSPSLTPNSPFPLAILIVILVVALVAATMILIRIFFKKNGAGGERKQQ